MPIGSHEFNTTLFKYIKLVHLKMNKFMTDVPFSSYSIHFLAAVFVASYDKEGVYVLWPTSLWYFLCPALPSTQTVHRSTAFPAPATSHTIV